MVTHKWGVPLDERTADMLDEVRLLCPLVPLTLSQGSYNTSVGASAGTHAGAGACDARGANLTAAQRQELVEAMRKVGFAAWDRTGMADWPPHIHAIAVAEGGRDDRGGLSPAAHDQVRDYFAGRDGMAAHGPDYHTRDHVGVTWETYLQQTPTPAPEESAMLVIRPDTSNTQYLVSFHGRAGIANPADSEQIRRALADPMHIAVVSQGTWENIAAAAKK